MSQPKHHSLIEAVVNTGLGFFTSVVAGWLIIYPMFDIDITLMENAGATAMFTLISVIKAYAVRRAANWHATKEK